MVTLATAHPAKFPDAVEKASRRETGLAAAPCTPHDGGGEVDRLAQ